MSRSGTTFKVQFFSDSTRETEVANYSVTTTAQTVRYLYLKSYSQNSGQAWAGYLDNIKIYKDQSSPTPVKPTNVQNNSILVEKDTARRFWFDKGAELSFTDDYDYTDQSAADAAWVPTDTAKIRVNVTNDNLAYTAVNDGSNDLVTYDLGTGNVSETKWVLRWKQTISTLTDGGTNQSRFVIGLGDTITGAATNQDFIGMYIGWFNTSAHKHYYTNWANGGRGDTANSSEISLVPATGTKYYELIRTSASTFEFSISSTSAYTKDVLSTVSRTGVTATGLRYIKMFNREGGSGGAQIIGTVDDISFYNAVTEVTSDTWTREGALDKTGLKAYWRFNETSGNIINQAEAIGSTDSADNTTGAGGSDLITSGTTYNVSKSPMNYSLQFDGSNDYAKAGTSSSAWNFMHSTTAKWTLCFWADMTNNGSGTVMSTAATNNANVGIQIMSTSTSGIFRARVTDAGAVVTQLTTTSGVIPQDNAMHFYKLTYDQSLSSDNMKLSVDNGTNITQTKTSNAPTDGNAYQAMYIGMSDTTNFPMAGEFAEMSIWSRVLTDAEVTAIYNSGSGVFPLF